MSHHMLVKLRPDYKGPHYEEMGDLVAEIQVRTVVMDAWAAISHYLDYKTEEAIPSSLRKDFFAMSGLFYVADKHFETFFKASEASRDNAQQQKASKNQEVNLDTLTAFLSEQFPHRSDDTAEETSLLVGELYGAGVRTIGELKDIVSRANNALLAWEADDPPHEEIYDDETGEFQSRPTRYSRMGAIRLMLALTGHRNTRYTGLKKYRKLVVEPVS